MRALVSVKNLLESSIALQQGISLIDLKAPDKGALGNLELSLIKSICMAIQGRAEVSATLGDIPLDEQGLIDKVLNTHLCGVDYVKIGLFSPFSPDHLYQFQALPRHIKLIAVLFAEDVYPKNILFKLKQAGFFGVMLDTRIKNGRNLFDYLSLQQLKEFVAEAHALKLMVGLAGALSLDMWAQLDSTNADYLGFRSAVCDNGRESELNPMKLNYLTKVVQYADKNSCAPQNTPSQIKVDAR